MNPEEIHHAMLLDFYRWVQCSAHVDRAHADLWAQAEQDGTMEVSSKALDRAVINLYLKERAK